MRKRNDAARIISGLFKVTPAYVRMIIKDSRKKKYKSQVAENIRAAHKNYATGKKSLIKNIKSAA